MLPDRAAHTLDRIWLRWGGTALDLESNVAFYLETHRKTEDGEVWDTLNLEIYMDSEACLRWIRENTDLPVMSRREASMTAVTDLPAIPAAVREP